MTLFSLTDLTVDVPGRRLLHGLTLEVPKGKLVALIGHNGSGKSTLLKTLARQMPTSGGAVRLDGRDLGAWSARAIARRLAFLPQATPPADGMTVAELVALGRYPWHGALGRFTPDDHAAVARALSECGVAGLADRLVDTLSGGERQRAWLAMMVAQGAEALLLDEPISALDVSHAVEVMTLVRAMCHDQGRSAVVVLHEVNMAARYCDHVIALRDGAVVMQGTPADLMRPDTLRHVYGLPMTVLTRPNGPPVAVPA
ncbi:ABC transporter ATP-binding protein [Falsirhodobacter halotolerans]|uniref:ABC transporter ATP-binding protein n=1 Tax=Falsirhodobacter halotolerans TaxID=1146892 RepID=UPI001FD1D49F|nr:ATP-binding cassette domain-containing protein [Falsirhodobacter halotolerans]MCJ8141144.1 ATP-binding cassette domain-containing protein [Falsirhodobacter halotolerans]